MKTLSKIIGALFIVVLLSSCETYQPVSSNSSINNQPNQDLLTTNFLIENSDKFIELIESYSFGQGFHLRVLGIGKERAKDERSYNQFLKKENGQRMVFYTTPDVLNYFDAMGFEIVNITERDNRRSFILKRGKSLEQKTKNKDFDFYNEQYSNALH